MANEFTAGVKRRVTVIHEALKHQGLSGSDEQIATMLGVEPSTVWRWKNETAAPRKRQALCLAILARIAGHQGGTPESRSKRAQILIDLADREAEPLTRGYEDALTLVGWNEIVPNACEFRPDAAQDEEENE